MASAKLRITKSIDPDCGGQFFWCIIVQVDGVSVNAGFGYAVDESTAFTDAIKTFTGNPDDLEVEYTNETEDSDEGQEV